MNSIAAKPAFSRHCITRRVRRLWIQGAKLGAEACLDIGCTARKRDAVDAALPRAAVRDGRRSAG